MMTTDTPFVSSKPMALRPPAYPGESAQGWLLRAHEINGRRWSEQDFLNRRKNLGRFMTGEDLSPLKEAGGENTEQFPATTVRDMVRRTG